MLEYTTLSEACPSGTSDVPAVRRETTSRCRSIQRSSWKAITYTTSTWKRSMLTCKRSSDGGTLPVPVHRLLLDVALDVKKNCCRPVPCSVLIALFSERGRSWPALVFGIPVYVLNSFKEVR
ncbi:hypothetical protein EVAR_4519_1 [Eumeta japonica]|uniref:Uncharacterized protein n=1 Tax=Eumeta variegata TaxID=151549 RepID=A0A4C1SYL4_EUMVA|nr:hypothetical protein EVAR_4519_1 [Eumeta japonica]